MIGFSYLWFLLFIIVNIFITLLNNIILTMEDSYGRN